MKGRFAHQWVDFLKPYLNNLDIFRDDVYIIEIWGASRHSDLQDPFHAGCERVLLELVAAWNKFFEARHALYYHLAIPKIIIVYCGDLVVDGKIALTRESGRGQRFVAINGIALSPSESTPDVLEKLEDLEKTLENTEITIRDRRPKVLARLFSLHGYPKIAPWSDSSDDGFRNGPYLSHSMSNPEDKYPIDKRCSEKKVPIVKTAKVISAMKKLNRKQFGVGFIPPLFFSCCYAAKSAQAALEIYSSMLVWGEIEDSVDEDDDEKLCSLGDELHSVTIYAPNDDCTTPSYLPTILNVIEIHRLREASSSSH